MLISENYKVWCQFQNVTVFGVNFRKLECIEILEKYSIVVVVVINSPNIGTPRIEWNKVKC